MSHIRPIGAVIQDLAQTLGIQKKLQEYDAVIQWEHIVGQNIAAVTTATKIVKGVLYIAVSNSVWRNELVMRKKEIIEKINNHLHEEVVKDIRFQ
ncbi:MAG: DUF721 domain-containing protein [bacterium]